jgi:3'(2'), 5'-bisphosphate nucleotidase
MSKRENPCALLDEVIETAQRAGHAIMAVYESEFTVAHKDDHTPLTEADMAAHNAIVADLKKLTPHLPVLSEESAQVPYAERSRWTNYWLVDPLDGTREFIKRNGEFTVNIALIDNHRPVLGVIYVPVMRICYFACAGLGAYKQEAAGGRSAIHVSSCCGNVVRVAGSRSHGSPEFDDFLARLGWHELVSMGSSLKSCLVAEGKADVYPRFGPTSEWDTAAAQCIVEEAGGCLMDMAMRPLRYNTKPSLINPSFLVVGDTGHEWMRYIRA